MSNVIEYEEQLIRKLNLFQQSGAISILRQTKMKFVFRIMKDFNRQDYTEMLVRVDYRHLDVVHQEIISQIESGLSGNIQRHLRVKQTPNVMVFNRRLTENYADNISLQTEAKKFVLMKMVERINKHGKQLEQELSSIGISESKPKKTAKLPSVSKSESKGGITRNLLSFFTMKLLKA